MNKHTKMVGIEYGEIKMTEQTLKFKMWFRQFESYWDSNSQQEDLIKTFSWPELSIEKQRAYGKYYAEHYGAYRYEETQ